MPFLSYIYTNYFIGKKLRFKSAKHILFYLSVCYLIYFLFLFYLNDDKAKFIYNLKNGNFTLSFVILNFIFLGNNIYYALLNISQINKAKKYLKANIDQNKIHFILIFNYALLSLTLISVFSYLILPPFIAEFIIMPILMIIIFFIVLFSARNCESLFTRMQLATFIKESKIVKEGKTIITEKIYDYKLPIEKINNEIKDNIFLDNSLTLTSFSVKIAVKPYLLSQIFKSHYKTNFYDFINKKRIGYSIGLLKEIEKNKLSIEGVGLSSGFNSRVSYYRNFKKSQGVTPKEFIKSLKV
ncbi:MAG: AraC family transcriptional regulator [Flavobacteriaceae bacterium]|nr:AraC family transcriptional regulator [Flavobacteriaceae bacterium]